jgi:threonine dehydrogenase-like Zn-dependent dehydrogenase
VLLLRAGAVRLLRDHQRRAWRDYAGTHAHHPPDALFGYPKLHGGVDGGQSDFVRVPKANVGPMKVPGSLSDERVLFLSDILTAGYQAAMNARITQGSRVAIFGAGPVGLMAAACARLLGAETIYMIDQVDYRLQFAADTYGVIPLNFERDEDFPTNILQQTRHRGVDASIDAIGFEAKGSAVETALTAVRPRAGATRRCAGPPR